MNSNLRELTLNERTVLDILAQAWNQFVELPVIHPQDQVEFMQAIHRAQNIVMSRVVMRQELGWPKAIVDE